MSNYNVTPPGQPVGPVVGGGPVYGYADPNGQAAPNDDLITFSNGATFDPTPTGADPAAGYGYAGTPQGYGQQQPYGADPYAQQQQPYGADPYAQQPYSQPNGPTGIDPNGGQPYVTGPYGGQQGGYVTTGPYTGQPGGNVMTTPNTAPIGGGWSPQWQDRFGALFAQYTSDANAIMAGLAAVQSMNKSAPELAAYFTQLNTPQGAQEVTTLLSGGASGTGNVGGGGSGGLTPDLEAKFTQLYLETSGSPEVAADIVNQLRQSPLTTQQLTDLGVQLTTTEEGQQLIAQSIAESRAYLGLPAEAAPAPTPEGEVAPEAAPEGEAPAPEEPPKEPAPPAEATGGFSPLPAIGSGLLGGTLASVGFARSAGQAKFTESLKTFGLDPSTSAQDRAKISQLLEKMGTKGSKDASSRLNAAAEHRVGKRAMGAVDPARDLPRTAADKVARHAAPGLDKADDVARFADMSFTDLRASVHAAANNAPVPDQFMIGKLKTVAPAGNLGLKMTKGLKVGGGLALAGAGLLTILALANQPKAPAAPVEGKKDAKAGAADVQEPVASSDPEAGTATSES